MPTVHKRVMLNVPQDTLENLEKISKVEKRSMAMTCLMLIEAAVKLPKFRDMVDALPEVEDSDTVVKEMGLDKLTPERLKELQQVLAMLQKLKS